MKTLVVTNLCYGSFRPYCIMSCVKPYDVVNNICNISKNFDYTLIINDAHAYNDEEFKFLPYHHIINSLDAMPMRQIELQFKSKYLYKLSKNTTTAFTSEHNKMILDTTTVVLCGFVGSIDLLDTAKQLLSFDKEVLMLEDCFGDLTIELKKRTVVELKSIGVKFIDRNYLDV
jgi:nicotinamidase-related amidase